MGTKYMTQLSKWARWMLPKQEAEDVVADYRDIVGSPPRPEEELLRDLGKPRDVIRPLVQPKQYRVWLVLFLFMSACILTLGVSPTGIAPTIWWLYFGGWVGVSFGGLAVAVLGSVIALVWFRRQGRKEACLPKAIPILLGVLMAWCGAGLLFCWMAVRDFDSFLNMLETMRPFVPVYSLIRYVMICGSAVISLAGEVGLIKARTKDRRWTAVYIMALAAMLTSLMYVRETGRMTFTGTPEEMFQRILMLDAWIISIGLAGAGVALC